MKIVFSPQRRDDALSLSVAGDVLAINGNALDFSGVPDGATLPRAAVTSDWIAGDVERVGGVLQVPVILPHGDNPSHALAFPEPITTTSDGPVTLPTDQETAQ